MHKGDQVYVLSEDKNYHLKDDDCPYSFTVMNGNKPALVFSEDEAKSRGLKLCKHCCRKEDLKYRKGLRLYNRHFEEREVSHYPLWESIFNLIGLWLGKGR